jgi:hypothetical protein
LLCGEVERLTQFVNHYFALSYDYPVAWFAPDRNPLY